VKSLNTTSVEILQGLLRLARLQGLIGGHFLCEASSFGEQQADVLDKVGLKLVLRDPSSSRQDFPVPAFSNAPSSSVVF
jgi:hypothetical protein